LAINQNGGCHLILVSEPGYQDGPVMSSFERGWELRRKAVRERGVGVCPPEITLRCQSVMPILELRVLYGETVR